MTGWGELLSPVPLSLWVFFFPFFFGFLTLHETDSSKTGEIETHKTMATSQSTKTQTPYITSQNSLLLFFEFRFVTFCDILRPLPETFRPLLSFDASSSSRRRAGCLVSTTFCFFFLTANEQIFVGQMQTKIRHPKNVEPQIQAVTRNVDVECSGKCRTSLSSAPETG